MSSSNPQACIQHLEANSLYTVSRYGVIYCGDLYVHKMYALSTFNGMFPLKSIKDCSCVDTTTDTTKSTITTQRSRVISLFVQHFLFSVAKLTSKHITVVLLKHNYICALRRIFRDNFNIQPCTCAMYSIYRIQI